MTVLAARAARARRLLPILDRFLEAAAGVSVVRRKQRALLPLVKKLEGAVSAAFLDQGKAFLRRLARFRSKFPELQEAGDDGGGESLPDWLAPLFDKAAVETVRAFSEPLDEFTAAALAAGAQALIGEVGVEASFDLANPRAVEWMAEHGAERVTRINDTTRRQIHDIVVKAVDEGWSYDRTARAIIERFAEFAVGKPQEHIDSRAHLVAVTETAMAYEAGNRIAVQDLMDSGLTMEMKWLTVGDNRVSDGCRENQAAGWIPAGGEFPSGHQHPPRFPGCRCCALYRRKGVREARLAERHRSKQPRDKRGRFARTGTASAEQFNSLTPKGVMPLGKMHPSVLRHWPQASTRRVVLTGERRNHYLESHPEMASQEHKLSGVVLSPSEVHRNIRDPQIGIFYQQQGNKYLRAAVWISDTRSKQNSVHSFRWAEHSEIEAGRRAGRAIWKKD